LYTIYRGNDGTADAEDSAIPLTVWRSVVPGFAFDPSHATIRTAASWASPPGPSTLVPLLTRDRLVRTDQTPVE